MKCVEVNQFDKQAKAYADWHVTRNVDYLNQFYEFCGVKNNQELIDIACGSGDFVINSAEKIKKAKGIDASSELIKIADANKEAIGLSNISFECKSIMTENMENEKYDVVLCRMAFHHFKDYKKAFENCVLYGKEKVVIGMQDIICHDDEEVDQYFNVLEKLVDPSHEQTLSKQIFENLYETNNISITKNIVLEREICADQYIAHAVQNEEDVQKLDQHILMGLQDEKISKYIFIKKGRIFFKRKILLINGNRKASKR